MDEGGSFAVEGGSFGKWSRQARILFIREVEVRPALWTTQLHASRDPNLRELRLQIARSVSPVLGFNITCYDVALQWRQLKKQYKRYLKLCEQFEKDNSRTLRPSFSFAKQMKFLLKDNAFYERCFGSEKRSVLNEQPFSNPTQDEECRESRKLRSLSTSNNYKSAILCSSDPQEDNVTCHEKNIHGLNEAEASGHWQEAAPTTEACDVQPQFSNFDRKQRLERDITDDDADARWWPYEARVMLIHEYRKRPALWTAQQDRRRCTVYAQCALRHEIAQLMSAKFDFKITGEDVARQWKYLKCQHRRYLRSIKRFEDDGIKRPLFQYAKFMNFLLKDDDYMSGLGLEKQFVLNEQQQPQLEVESLAWSVDSDGGQDEPNGVDNEVASVLHLHTREGEATAVEKTADYVSTAERNGLNQMSRSVNGLCDSHPGCSEFCEQKQFGIKLSYSEHRQPQEEARASVLHSGCYDMLNEVRRSLSFESSPISVRNSAVHSAWCLSDGKTVPKEEDSQWPNDVQKDANKELHTSAIKKNTVQRESSALDEHDHFGRTVASALRRAASYDTTIVQQFRIDVAKMLVTLEQNVMKAMMQNR